MEQKDNAANSQNAKAQNIYSGTSKKSDAFQEEEKKDSDSYYVQQ